MEEKWSLRAFSEMETAETAKPATASRDIEAKANTRARVIYSPKLERTPDCKWKPARSGCKSLRIMRQTTKARSSSDKAKRDSSTAQANSFAAAKEKKRRWPASE